ncbi:hypothetical protein O181_080698 [Austropuccinia psidii MF-1]|uniref:Integrase catalytic domain-containing protein n=1 Tax=Austropuccinia psidii MF-1 TaxID=1389203 RepID=A0A9Q3IGR9_9BASI|nr:hypothetical protein [Austropuccinia psidii MF-1]
MDYTLPSTFLTRYNINLRHDRLGDREPAILKAMGLPVSNEECLVCQKNKSHLLPVKNYFYLTFLPPEFPPLDLERPINLDSISGIMYALTIVNQENGFKIVKFLKKNYEAFEDFMITKMIIENRHLIKIKKLVFNCGVEFLDKKFRNLSNDCGFIHIFSSPEKIQRNGFSERAHQTILERRQFLREYFRIKKHLMGKGS